MRIVPFALAASMSLAGCAPPEALADATGVQSAGVKVQADLPPPPEAPSRPDLHRGYDEVD